MIITCDRCPATLTVTIEATHELDRRAVPRAVRLIAQQQGWCCEAFVRAGADVTQDLCPGCRR